MGGQICLEDAGLLSQVWSSSMGSLGLCLPIVPGLNRCCGWQEHQDLWLKEEKAARVGAAPSWAVLWAGATLSFQPRSGQRLFLQNYKC